MTCPSGHRLRLGPRSYDLAGKVLVIGIVDLTEASSGARRADPAMLRQAEALVAAGADILEVGGAVHGAGSGMSEAGDADRVVPAAAALAARFDTAVAVGTGDADVLAAAFEAGAVLGRDVGGCAGAAWLAAASGAGASVVATHISRSSEEDGDSDLDTGDLVAEVLAVLGRHSARAQAAGLAADRVVLDAGLDLGKTARQRAALLGATGTLAALGQPLLVSPGGPFAGERPVGLRAAAPDAAGSAAARPAVSGRAASLAAAAYAVAHGCRIVRVHDVAGTVRVVRMIEQLLRTTP